MKIFAFFLVFVNFSIHSQQQHLSHLNFGTDSTLDIMTWNIEWFPKYGQTTADSVAVILEALEMDIIACQESDDSVAFKNMLSQFPSYQTFIQSSNYPGLAFIYNSNTISLNNAYEIYASFPYWSAFPRAPQVLDITYDNQTFILINNHLKCCGDGYLDLDDDGDEENRRLQASLLLENYIQTNFPTSNVILLGDLNDEITDAPHNNVFQPFLNAPNNYQFADDLIANTSPSNWTYPAWPSQLDHILISNELFDDFNTNGSAIQTIRIDDYLNNGLSSYDAIISDHRPLALKLNIQPAYLNLTYNDNSKDVVTVYPNPANESIYISMSAKLVNSTLSIIRLDGKTVLNSTILESQYHFNTTHFQNGTYLLLIQSEKEVKTMKIVIQH